MPLLNLGNARLVINDEKEGHENYKHSCQFFHPLLIKIRNMLELIHVLSLHCVLLFVPIDAFEAL
jgi:hypothetical protein